MSDAASEEPENAVSWASKTKQALVTLVHAPVLLIALIPIGTESVTKSTGYVPGMAKVWGWVLKWGYRGIMRATGAQLIGHELKQGRLLHKPLQFDSEANRWQTLDGEEWWNGRDDGEDTYLGPGGVPCAWAASGSSQLGSTVQAEVSEALDLGYGSAVFSDAQVSINNVQMNGQQQAMSDGGVSSRVTPRHPGVLKDYVIPLNRLYIDEENEETVDARLISLEKYYETYPENVDSEEMKKQEDRGRLAEQDKDWGRYAMKMLLIAGAIIVLTFAVVFVVPKLFGGGGSSGGSMIPLFIKPALGLLG